MECGTRTAAYNHKYRSIRINFELIVTREEASRLALSTRLYLAGGYKLRIDFLRSQRVSLDYTSSNDVLKRLLVRKVIAVITTVDRVMKSYLCDVIVNPVSISFNDAWLLDLPVASTPGGAPTRRASINNELDENKDIRDVALVFLFIPFSFQIALATREMDSTRFLFYLPENRTVESTT